MRTLRLLQRGRAAWWCSAAVCLGALVFMAAPGAIVAARSLAAQEAPAQWHCERDRWYQLRLDGAPCGWMNTQEWRSSDGGMRRSIQESLVRLGRAGSEVAVSVFVRFDETSRGDPVMAEVRQRSGQEPIEQIYRFDPADRSTVRVVSRQGRREVESVQQLPGEPWLTPLAAEEFAAARRRANAREFRIRTVDPASGMKPAEIVASALGAGTFTVGGREVPVSRWSVISSVLQLPTIEEWSGDDVLVRSSTDMPIGRLEAVLSDRAASLGAIAGPAVEVMVRTMVRPDRPLVDVERLGKARFRVSAISGPIADLPSIGAQTVTRESDSALIVEVDDARSSPAAEGEIGDERFRRASVSIDCDDPLIRELAARELRELPDAAPLDRAEALRRAVHRHIRRKEMHSVFASASETVRSREGDCTEHAVLLAALLRAEGIPSRVVSGLVYCREFAGEREVFGWHMWTQALVNDRWLDLDATLPGPTRHHAGHIITGASAMEQGALDAEWTTLIGLIGNLRIEVLESALRERSPSR